MTEFVLLRPLWLLLLPIIAALGFWLFRRPASVGTWQAAIDPSLLNAMSQIGRVPQMSSGGRTLLPLIGAGFVAVALAGPAVERRDTPAFRNLDGVVLAIDLSASVSEGDHLDPLKTAARVVLASIGSRPAALIVFAGDAYLAAPLTSDTTQIGLTVSLLEPDMIPDEGSRPALALERASTILTDASIITGDVILLTDDAGGADTARAAQSVAELGAKLWVVTPDAADAQAETLAKSASGAAFSAREATQLTQAMREGRVERLARSEIELIYKADLGRYFLLPALLVLSLSFRRGA